MLSENEGWAVGTTGRIIKYDGKTWSPVESTVDTELLAVHFLAPDFGFATGKNSTILFFDGQSWTPQNSGLENTSDHIEMPPSDGHLK
ncbi:MAG: hypothetical protein GX116_08525 [Fibrobacter sp.]|jgi:photosystem II stability/assembly factor-like uncharacterized protein|nr:hypothetical protein [Fibrobacter sp.]